MISQGLARELKEAGLVWEPKQGDCAYDHYFDRICRYLVVYNGDYRVILPNDDIVDFPRDMFTFTPSLSHLLAEIEGRGYLVDLKSNISIGWPNKWKCDIISQGKCMEFFEQRIWADTPEEAAGLALLWVLRGERDG
ncbi:hypothetical protein FDZ73_22365 [bacterium]|nr:MAG: hypothetical protein FDZ73_22365 [bacterium]